MQIGGWRHRPRRFVVRCGASRICGDRDFGRRPRPVLSAPTSPLDQVAELCGSEWPHLEAARRRSAERREELSDALAGVAPSDTTVVVFGSMARGEMTDGSDLDWTLLVDGPADPHHLDVAREIGERFSGRAKLPGREGIFGTLAFSHEIVHNIGGEDDTNRNTTRRILLLLESRALGDDEAYTRVLRNVSSRYLDEDRGLWTGSGRPKVPRFLLNDIARYWRTMLVDFAYKQRSRAGEGWALRNLKLRMSRKLIFLSGLITCFMPMIALTDEEREAIFRHRNQQRLLAHLERWTQHTPLEIVADAILRVGIGRELVGELFGSYEAFLALLQDREAREHLERLPAEQVAEDLVFARGREIAYRFQDAIGAIFLRGDSELTRLTIEHGIF